MRDYFCGWYFKCQSDRETVALIPAFHRSGDQRAASVQVITDDGSWNIPFPYEQFRKHGAQIAVGDSRFGPDGLVLHLCAPGIRVDGTVRFGPGTPIRYDIMGPFRFVPLMECRHSIVSMYHRIDGVVRINETDMLFHGGRGYIEGDRGRSFPKRYVWSQCFFEDGSLFISVADTPFLGRSFTGVIAAVRWQGKEYRLATYLGAKAISIANGELVIRQGDITLTARLIEKAAHPLRAPVGGNMCRTIHESASCRAAYQLEKGGQTLFAFESDRASFEYEY